MAILLNMDSKMIRRVSAEKALTLYFSGKVYVLKYGKDAYNTIDRAYNIPEVVILKRYADIPTTPIRLSKKAIHERDGYICQYCGTRDGKMTIDHIIPRSRGGRNTWANMVSCCSDCNSRKGSKTLDECGMALNRQPAIPMEVFKAK